MYVEVLGLGESLGVYQPVEGEPAGPASGVPSALRLEMRYDTWGTCGQHHVQHPLFLVGGRLLTADEAVAENICTVEIQDHHSRRNAHFYRVYTLIGEADAVIVFECAASSSHHRSDIKVVYGNAEITEDIVDGEREGYIINKTWFLATCQRGAKPRILLYSQVLQSRKIAEEKKKLRMMEEERKKIAPRININMADGQLIVSGETFYIRDAIKVAAAAAGGKASWNAMKKSWIISNADKNAFVSKLQELVPGAIIE
ncbi:MAG: hypothetical protein QW692_01990 [Nitrososphaerota archaeon]